MTRTGPTAVATSLSEFAAVAGTSAPSDRASGARQAMSRRTFLRRAGIGAGAIVAVAGVGGGWRAWDQGVFIPETGDAYGAWSASLLGSGQMPLVNAAILAANAHDTQPWRFVVANDQIDLYADRSRSMGAMDPVRREMDMSLGCALENLVLTARANGLAPTVTLLPDASEPNFIARVHLTTEVPDRSPLFEAIPKRHTNRGAFAAGRRIDPEILGQAAALVDTSMTGLIWLDADPARSRFGRLTIDATAAIVADPEMARDDFAWYRQDWGEIQRRKDGITIDTAGLDEPMRIIVRLLPPSDRRTMQQGWLEATATRHVPTAAAFGLLSVRDRADTAQRIEAGRLFERVHLFATTHGLALQPLNQVFERIDRETTSGLTPTFTRAIQDLVPAGQQALGAFRVGYGTTHPHLAPRRPVIDVIGRP